MRISSSVNRDVNKREKTIRPPKLNLDFQTYSIAQNSLAPQNPENGSIARKQCHSDLTVIPEQFTGAP